MLRLLLQQISPRTRRSTMQRHREKGRNSGGEGEWKKRDAKNKKEALNGSREVLTFILTTRSPICKRHRNSIQKSRGYCMKLVMKKRSRKREKRKTWGNPQKKKARNARGRFWGRREERGNFLWWFTKRQGSIPKPIQTGGVQKLPGGRRDNGLFESS